MVLVSCGECVCLLGQSRSESLQSPGSKNFPAFKAVPEYSRPLAPWVFSLLPWPLGVTVRAKAPGHYAHHRAVFFLSSLGLRGDIRFTSCSVLGTGKPGPEAGRPKGLEFLLASAPLQGAVAVAAGHSAKWRGEGISAQMCPPTLSSHSRGRSHPRGPVPGW